MAMVGQYATGNYKSSPAPALNYSRGGSRAGGRARRRFVKGGGLETGGKKMQFNLGSLGGLLGGSSKSAGYAQEDFERQKELDRLIWERSTPDVTGVGGTVRWDRDKNMVTATMSPENQAIYDAMIERQQMFGGQADAMAAGGWKDMQQQRFDEMRGLYTESDALAEQRRLEREQATGASSTGRYWGSRAEQDAINQRNLGLQNQAFAESQQLLDSTLGRQSGAIGMMSGLGSIANTMIKMPTPQPVANLQGMSQGSTAWADVQAFESAKRQQAKSDAWGSILGSLFK